MIIFLAGLRRIPATSEAAAIDGAPLAPLPVHHPAAADPVVFFNGGPDHRRVQAFTPPSLSFSGTGLI
jgi:hypothetical protein